LSLSPDERYVEIKLRRLIFFFKLIKINKTGLGIVGEPRKEKNRLHRSPEKVCCKSQWQAAA
jgi:hypothetical protein